MQAGAYVVDRDKGEQIVQGCLQPYDKRVLAMRQPHGNIIHPEPIRYLLAEANEWGIDEQVIAPYVDQVIRKHQIKVSTNKL